MALRTTVIAKTDIVRWTERLKSLSRTQLSALLGEHKNFIVQIVDANQGTIIKGEGDAFWLIFPSATAAALAAIEMQHTLREMQSGRADENRLAIRVAIALGDVLHQDADIFGDAVNLTARIEAITPPDEIYLSEAAYHALNKAEVRASLVDTVSLKGVGEAQRIYKIDQQHRTRVISGQCIVVTDVGGFTDFSHAQPIQAVEALLTTLERQANDACRAYGGTIRLVLSDGHVMTFASADRGLQAVEMLGRAWYHYVTAGRIPCTLRVGLHLGDVNIFRSSMFGPDVNLAFWLSAASARSSRPQETVSILASSAVFNAVRGADWQMRFQRVALPESLQPKHAYRDTLGERYIYHLPLDMAQR